VRDPLPFLGVALLLLPLSGCLGGPILPQAGAATEGDIRIVDASGAGIPFAQLSVALADVTVAVASADAEGVLAALPAVPAGAEVVVGAPGYAPIHYATSSLPRLITLAAADAATPGPFLRWLPFVDLACPSIDPPPYSCDRFGEPVLEVAGDGTFWASATSAVGRSPPIWTSRDGGRTFQLLEGETTGLLRDATGIEGDFAIDEAGHVYFFDILAGAAYFTSYEADGTHRWTVPHAWKPLVDRPWVRAGASDQVWVLYNTGSSSILLASRDGGRTFDVLGGHEFPCGLAVLGQHPVERGHLYVSADCGQGPRLWTSLDGGATWDAGQDVPVPPGSYDSRRMDTFVVPTVDAAGNVYVAYTHALPRPSGVEASKWTQTAVFVARRGPDGAWSTAIQVSPAGQAHMVWPVAGAAGRLGLAWYQATGDVEGADSQWRLVTAASVDADAPGPHFQLALGDPEVLAKGALGRQLGDFLEARLTPDGRLAVVYGKQVGRDDAFKAASSADDQMRFVLSQPTLDLAPTLFLNGPKAAG
jgi:hypothetical protein